MHIKFLAHGTGDPRRAVAYLTGVNDYNGLRRESVKVLRGNPSLVGELAANLRTVHRYTSGVIAWSHVDAPTPAEIEAVLHDFERVAFAGLSYDQYAWSAIQHVDNDGSTHVHVIAPRVELRSGRALNIAPPGWESSFDPVRDAWNHAKGWARPDDPARARALQQGRHSSSKKALERAALNV